MEPLLRYNWSRKKNSGLKESPARKGVRQEKNSIKMLVRVSRQLNAKDFALVRKTKTIPLRLATVLLKQTMILFSTMDSVILAVQT